MTGHFSGIGGVGLKALVTAQDVVAGSGKDHLEDMLRGSVHLGDVGLAGLAGGVGDLDREFE